MDARAFKELIEKYLEDYFNKKYSFNKLIYEAMSYSLNIGGKRVRPILFFLTYDLYKKDYDKVLPMAGAIEMIHTYSLIHDDLPCMDNDDLRRGKPTSHKVFGEAIAVLAGDALLNEAFNIMFKFCIENDRKALEASQLIALSAGAEGMIGGQVVDIISEGKNISEEELLYMHSKKTGELIKSAVLAGALLGDASQEEIDILSKYGEKLGLAFQIKDDTLNVIGNTSLLGKSVNSDENNHKTNFITTYGLEECLLKSKAITDECIELLNKLPRETKSLQELTLFLLQRDF